MTHGTYAEICLHTPDLAESVAFFEKLGFKKLSDDVLTDGSNNYRLVASTENTPRIAFYGTNLSTITAAGITLDAQNGTTSPSGANIAFSTDAPPRPMPDGAVIARTPISELGKFGEYTIYTEDLQTEFDFWQKLGFKSLHRSEEPYPWGIMSDDLIVIGVHQPGEDGDKTLEGQPLTGIYLTYFAADMPERITKVKNMGCDIKDIKPFGDDGKVISAQMTAPGGQKFYLFTGEI